MSNKKDLRITPTYWKQIKILRQLKYACKKYLEERECAIYSRGEKDTEYMRESYRISAKTYRKAILFTFELWDLPLLQSWRYSGLKALIKEVIEDSWMKDMIAYEKQKDREEEETKYKKENYGSMSAYLQYNADRLKNATIVEVRDRDMYGEIISLVAEKEGKRYLLEAKAAKDQVGVCGSRISVEGLK